METTVIKNIPFELNKDNIVQRMHIHDDEDRARVHVLLDEALRIGNPKGIYAEWYIDEKDEHSVLWGLSFTRLCASTDRYTRYTHVAMRWSLKREIADRSPKFLGE